MKRLFVLIGIIAFFAIGQAQDVTISKAANYGYYTGLAGDTCIYGTTWDVIFAVELARDSRYMISHTIQADTMAGSSGNITIQVYGSYDLVNYTAIGSAVTWSAASAVYSANVNLNTYTTLASGTLTDAQHTRTTAAFNITTTDSLLYDDTLHVPAQTQTVAAQTFTDARTVTVTVPGVDFRYIKVLFTAASGGKGEIDYVGIKVTPVQVPW
jgi:hypothetical protein